jgi:hypothetical protein
VTLGRSRAHAGRIGPKSHGTTSFVLQYTSRAKAATLLYGGRSCPPSRKGCVALWAKLLQPSLEMRPDEGGNQCSIRGPLRFDLMREAISPLRCDLARTPRAAS